MVQLLLKTKSFFFVLTNKVFVQDNSKVEWSISCLVNIKFLYRPRIWNFCFTNCAIFWPINQTFQARSSYFRLCYWECCFVLAPSPRPQPGRHLSVSQDSWNVVSCICRVRIRNQMVIAWPSNWDHCPLSSVQCSSGKLPFPFLFFCEPLFVILSNVRPTGTSFPSGLCMMCITMHHALWY